MAGTVQNQGEEAQLLQTIEMFEVIAQSQPNDCQSLEILKEAYTKLGREEDVIKTSKRIAQAYMQSGQLSSAILEYETVLQRRPEDADVQKALQQIEDRANNMSSQSTASPESAASVSAPQPDLSSTTSFRKRANVASTEVDDGRKAMHRIFVEGKIIKEGDFDFCWRATDLTAANSDVIEPFIQTLADKNFLPVEKSLKLLSDRAHTAFLSLDKYDVDLDLARGFPAEACRRWCVLPFDRMSKSILVATANPFNQQAVKDLAEATTHRLLWYLATPTDLMINLRKAFR
jgi:tetratricopeptide (TPR) repeat protein